VPIGITLIEIKLNFVINDKYKAFRNCLSQRLNTYYIQLCNSLVTMLVVLETAIHAFFLGQAVYLKFIITLKRRY
jgi:hypothetical protein